MYYPKTPKDIDEWNNFPHYEGCDASPWDTWFDRVMCYCQPGGVMHECCSGCGYAIDGCFAEDGIHGFKI